MNSLTWLNEYIPEADETLDAHGDTGPLKMRLRQAARDLRAAESKLEEALHGAEGKRWNMHRSGDGEIQVCFGDHERGTGCQYVTFVEKSRLSSALDRADKTGISNL